MNKKSIAGLLLFGCLVMAILIYGASVMTGNGGNAGANQNSETDTKDDAQEMASSDSDNTQVNVQSGGEQAAASEEPWLLTNPSDTGAQSNASDASASEEDTAEAGSNDAITTISGDEGQSGQSVQENPKDNEEDTAESALATNIKNGAIVETEVCQLIIDGSQVDYEAYIPTMVSDSKINQALDINNPDIGVDAEAAILFDAETKEVLYYKNPVTAVFPASTTKLLTALVALDWCGLEEEVRIGNEVKLIARDSTRAYLAPGEVLTVRNLLEGMLLPSGNDAAYATAAYVGKKSLKHEGANREEAVREFVRLMNEKAKQLGLTNSCFKSPDGYDAIGQYTTAYDMGLIGLAAVQNETIREICKKSSSRNIFPSGEDVTWNNTNSLIKQYSGRYYSPCIGLKTGTSTMAGRCLIAAGCKNGKEVLCVIMNSSSTGRWSDAITLMDYGLD
jgi:D-alanyl-D-alanine carboxypeptidase (penicillin-binding protein 5/6)